MGWHVGMRPGPIVYGSAGEQVADCRCVCNEEEENRRNARLIAAAPALLAACRAVIENWGSGDLARAARCAAAAISKATGGMKK